MANATPVIVTTSVLRGKDAKTGATLYAGKGGAPTADKSESEKVFGKAIPFTKDGDDHAATRAFPGIDASATKDWDSCFKALKAWMAACQKAQETGSFHVVYADGEEVDVPMGKDKSGAFVGIFGPGTKAEPAELIACILRAQPLNHSSAMRKDLEAEFLSPLPAGTTTQRKAPTKAQGKVNLAQIR